MTDAQRDRYTALLADLERAEADARRLKTLSAIQRVSTLARQVKEAYRQIRATGRIGNR